MAILNNPEDFISGENVTAAKLNNLVDGATFLGGAGEATDGSTLEVNDGVGGDGSLRVKDLGITTAKLADGAVSTQKMADSAVTSGKIADDAVTFTKMQNIASSKVIGRITASSGSPEEVSILDEDAMSSNSNTSLATQQSIKAYVDNNRGNEVAILTGTIANGATIPLPGGYTQAQCKWMVGVGTISSSHGDHNSSHNVTFTANSSRVVTTTGIGTGSVTANYIIIGVK